MENEHENLAEKLVKIEGKIPVADAFVLEEVGKIMHWYYKSAGKNADINALLGARDRLSTLSYNVAHITGDFKDDYNSKYYIKKIEHNVAKQAYMSHGANGTEAEVDAIAKNKDNARAAADAESASFKIDLILKQINQVLQAMQQRLSFLIKEHERAHRGGPSTQA